MWMLTKEKSQQRRISRILRARCLFLWSQQAFFPSHCYSLPNGLTKKVAVAARMVVIPRLSNMDFYSPYLATATAECSLCQNVDQHWTTDMASLLGGISQHPVAHWLFGILPYRKGNSLFSLELIDILLFRLHNGSTKPPPVYFQNVLFTVIVFHIALLLISELAS